MKDPDLSNTHTADRLSSFIKNLDYLPIVRSVVINWHDAGLLALGLKKNCELRLRTGGKVLIKDRHDFFSFWFTVDAEMQLIKLYGKDIKIQQEHIEFEKFGRKIKFFYGTPRQLAVVLHMLRENFLAEQYGWLDVRRKQVVDIGANVGDTALYFAMKGAKKVYAFEPEKELFGLAKKNVSINKLRDRITLVNKPCGAKGGRGAVSLADVVRDYKIENGVLKSDCEGCEYGILLEAEDAELRKFGDMIIEYHRGPVNLEKRLRKAGFRTWYEVSPHPTIGVLYASLIN